MATERKANEQTSHRCLWDDESGQDLTECALLVALVALSSIVAMQRLAQA